MMASVASMIAASNRRRCSPSSTRNHPDAVPDVRVARETPPLRLRRLAAIIGVTVGVTVGYRETKRIRRDRRALRQMHGRGRSVRLTVVDRQRARRRLDFRAKAVGGRRQNHVLDRASEPQVHLANVGVHRPEIAGQIGVDLDRVGFDGEQPWLSVVRVGRQNGGRDQRQRRPAHRRIIPEPPRRVGVAFGQRAARRVGRAQFPPTNATNAHRRRRSRHAGSKYRS